MLNILSNLGSTILMLLFIRPHSPQELADITEVSVDKVADCIDGLTALDLLRCTCKKRRSLNMKGTIFAFNYMIKELNEVPNAAFLLEPEADDLRVLLKEMYTQKTFTLDSLTNALSMQEGPSAATVKRIFGRMRTSGLLIFNRKWKSGNWHWNFTMDPQRRDLLLRLF